MAASFPGAFARALACRRSPVRRSVGGRAARRRSSPRRVPHERLAANDDASRRAPSTTAVRSGGAPGRSSKMARAWARAGRRTLAPGCGPPRCRWRALVAGPAAMLDDSSRPDARRRDVRRCLTQTARVRVAPRRDAPEATPPTSCRCSTACGWQRRRSSRWWVPTGGGHGRMHLSGCARPRIRRQVARLRRRPSLPTSAAALVARLADPRLPGPPHHGGAGHGPASGRGSGARSGRRHRSGTCTPRPISSPTCTARHDVPVHRFRREGPGRPAPRTALSPHSPTSTIGGHLATTRNVAARCCAVRTTCPTCADRGVVDGDRAREPRRHRPHGNLGSEHRQRTARHRLPRPRRRPHLDALGR